MDLTIASTFSLVRLVKKRRRVNFPRTFSAAFARVIDIDRVTKKGKRKGEKSREGRCVGHSVGKANVRGGE